MKKARILVIGATGFLGGRLAPEIAKKQDIICLVRKTSNTRLLRKSKIKTILGDMLDKKSVNAALKGIDIVIHLASAHRKDNDEINVTGSRNIINCCKKNRVKRIIFISSMAVERKELDSYGKAKIKIEKMVKKSGLKYTIFRPSMIYSRDNLSLIGRVLKILPFFIPIVGSGEYKLSPTYIEDLNKIICRAIENKKSVNKTYDVAGPEKLSFNRIILLCKAELKINKRIIHIPAGLCRIILELAPIINPEAIKALNEDTHADISGLERDFKIKLTKFEKGIENAHL